MTTPKAYAYRWVGTMTIDGRPHKHLGNSDIPPTDLDPATTAALTSDQRRRIEDNPDLYQPITKEAHESKNTPPKWFSDFQERVAAAGNAAPEREPGETQANYMARVAPQNLLTEGQDPNTDPGATPEPAPDTATDSTDAGTEPAATE